MRIPPTSKHRPSLDDDIAFITPSGRMTGVVIGIDGDLYTVLVEDKTMHTALKHIIAFVPFDQRHAKGAAKHAYQRST